MKQVYKDLIKLSLDDPALQFKRGISKKELDVFLSKYNLDSNDELIEYFGAVNGCIVGTEGLLGINREESFLNIEFYKENDKFILNSQILPLATDGNGNIYVVLLDKNDNKYGSIYFIDLHEYPTSLSYAVASSIKNFIYFILKFETGNTRFGWPYDKEYMMANDPMLFEERFNHIFIWDE